MSEDEIRCFQGECQKEALWEVYSDVRATDPTYACSKHAGDALEDFEYGAVDHPLLVEPYRIYPIKQRDMPSQEAAKILEDYISPYSAVVPEMTVYMTDSMPLLLETKDWPLRSSVLRQGVNWTGRVAVRSSSDWVSALVYGIKVIYDRRENTLHKKYAGYLLSSQRLEGGPKVYGLNEVGHCAGLMASDLFGVGSDIDKELLNKLPPVRVRAIKV